VLNALLLRSSRTAVAQKYSQLIGALAAGLAMLIYVIFFIWQGNIFLINSAPFVIATVLLYIIKDRMKEGLRTFYYRQAFRWFPDYTIKIRNPNDNRTIGRLTESVCFLDEKTLSKEIRDIRNQEFHTELERFRRPESVIYYKKAVNLYHGGETSKARRYELNNIFRFNVHRFLEKASNPYHSYFRLNTDNLKLEKEKIPKVYHLNIIMRNQFFDENREQQVEIKKFRLVIDKLGIKRVEQLS